MKEKLMIIDGSSLLYRAFFAIPTLTDSHGNYTNAVYGFLTMLLKLYEEINPQYVAVAFDKDKHTFRNELYDGYKATRKPAPDELRPQFALIREVLACLGISVLEVEGYEGDDIIGTLAREVADLDVAVITGDRDALQLVDDRITVYLTKKGITNMLAVTPEVMRETYGYGPAQVIEMKALMGDSADNIPGVPGVGEKTALKLLDAYGTVRGVYDHLDDVQGKKLREKLADNHAQALLSRELATIRCDVPLAYGLADFLPHPRVSEVTELFRTLGFKNLLARLASFDRFADLETVETTVPDMTLLTKEDFPPERLCRRLVAAEAVYAAGQPAPSFRTLAIATEDGVLLVAAADLETYVQALSTAAGVITSDGKKLLKAAYGITGGRRIAVRDVTLAAYLLDPSRTAYGLSYLSEAFAVDFREDAGDEARQAAACAAFVYRLWPPIDAALAQHELLPLYNEIERPLLHTLAVMEMTGFAVDRQRLEEMDRQLSLEADTLENEIYDAAGEVFNVNSTKQLGVVLFEKLGLPLIKKTKTGYSTDQAVLEELSGLHPLIPKVLRYRELKKLISTYLDGLEPLISAETGRIYTSFNQMVTATGRLSSSDPNLQNIPIRTEQGRKIRSFFVPGPGYDYLLSGDYSQIELRLLAHLSQDPTMIDGFRKNQDIHRRTAAEVFGVPWEEVTAELRSHAKAVNFGIIYGISDFGLARNLGITRQQAKNYITSYFDRYGTIRKYLDSLIDDARERGIAKTMFGRIRPLPEINSKNFTRRSFAERTAMNTPIQGSAADIIKIAMNQVQEKLEKENLKSRILVQVHDELVLEVPAAERETAAALLKETMEQVVTLAVPLVVDIHWGKDWEAAK